MAVSYITPGTAVNHEQMNALFAELDRKLAAMMSGKSPWLVPDQRAAPPPGDVPFFPYGKLFSFVVAPGSSAWLPYLARWRTAGLLPATLYDHTIYTAAAAAQVPVSYDDALHIVHVNPNVAQTLPNLEQSLEAHTQLKPGDLTATPYYIHRGNYGHPERHYRLAVAELVCDGITNLTIPAHWNKYACLRIHNFQLFDPLLVTLPDGSTFSVPPVSCQAVRKLADGTWSRRFRYFWEFVAEDLRLYWCEPVGGLHESMRANNVANPALLHQVLDNYVSVALGFPTRGRVNWDEPMYDSAAVARYGDPNVASTRLGDLVLHRGDLVVASKLTTADPPEPWTFTTVPFTGLANLSSSLTALGLTVTVNATTQATTIRETRAGRTTDLISPGTNLLRHPTDGSSRVALNLNGAGITLGTGYLNHPVTGEYYNTVGGFNALVLPEYDLVDATVNLSYDLGTGAGPVTVPGRQLTWQARPAPPNYNGIQYFSAYQLVSELERTVTTPDFIFARTLDRVAERGLVVRFDAQYRMRGNVPVTDVQLRADPREVISFTGGGFLRLHRVEERSLQQGDEGWPRIGNHVSAGGSGSALIGGMYPAAVSFCTDPRIFTGALPGAFADFAANIARADANADGADFDVVVAAGQTYANLGVQAVYGPLTAGVAVVRGYRYGLGPPITPASGLVKCFPNPDWLHKFTPDDVWYAANRAALLAGAGKTGWSDWQDCRIILNSELYNFMGWRLNATHWPLFTLNELFPNLFRFADSGLRPRQECVGWKVSSGGDQFNRQATFTAFGVTPLTEADLPPSYHVWRDIPDFTRKVDITNNVVGAPYTTTLIIYEFDFDHGSTATYAVGGTMTFGAGATATLLAVEIHGNNIDGTFGRMTVHLTAGTPPVDNETFSVGGQGGALDGDPVLRTDYGARVRERYGPDYRWVSYAQVEALAARIGLPFGMAARFRPMMLKEVSALPTGNLVVIPGSSATAGVYRTISEPVEIRWTPWLPNTSWHLQVPNPDLDSYEWVSLTPVLEVGGGVAELRAIADFDCKNWVSGVPFLPDTLWGVNDAAGGREHDPWANEYFGGTEGSFAPLGLRAGACDLVAGIAPDYYIELTREWRRTRLLDGLSSRRSDGFYRRPFEFVHVNPALMPAGTSIGVSSTTSVVSRLIDPRFDLGWGFARVYLKVLHPVV